MVMSIILPVQNHSFTTRDWRGDVFEVCEIDFSDGTKITTETYDYSFMEGESRPPSTEVVRINHQDEGETVTAKEFSEHRLSPPRRLAIGRLIEAYAALKDLYLFYNDPFLRLIYDGDPLVNVNWDNSETLLSSEEALRALRRHIYSMQEFEYGS
jgi:hypothetical protein